MSSGPPSCPAADPREHELELTYATRRGQARGRRSAPPARGRHRLALEDAGPPVAPLVAAAASRSGCRAAAAVRLALGGEGGGKEREEERLALPPQREELGWVEN